MELEQPFATLGTYQITKFLGGDNVSKVKLGQDPENNTIHAIKIIRKDKIDVKKETFIENEIKTISALDHQNIIHFEAVNWDATYVKKNGSTYQTIAFTMEYAERGNLYEYLDQAGAFSEDVVRTYFQQLIEAVHYCHSQGITHRNLKLDNLLLDHNFNLKVSGFGLSTLLEGHFNSYLLTTRVGNEAYMAPELIQSEVYNGAHVDIFACGVILFALLSRKAPFDKADKKTSILYKLLAEKNYTKFWQAQEKELEKMGFMQRFSSELKDLIQGMLAYEPTERLTIEEIKSHAWYQGEVAPLICLVSELEDKLKIVQETHEAKELEKQKVKDLKRQIKALSQASNQTGGLGNFVGYRPFRSGEGENGDQEALKREAERVIDFSLKRKFTSFNLDTLPKARTQIFITSDVKSVFVSLYLACKQELNDFSVSKSNYKIKGRVVKDKGSCNLEVIVSRVGDGSLCVEFFKQNGDMILFYKVIDKIKSRLPIAPEEKSPETA